MTVLTDHASPYRSATLPQRAALQWQPTGCHYLLCERSAAAQLTAFAKTAHSRRYEMLGNLPIAEAEKRLAGMQSVDHLLAIGSEPYLQKIDQMAWRLGIEASQVKSERVGPETRDVLCMQCRAIGHGIARRIYRCACGTYLLVRDHYSARRGLYQGAPLPEHDALIGLLTRAALDPETP